MYYAGFQASVTDAVYLQLHSQRNLPRISESCEARDICLHRRESSALSHDD